MIELARMAAMSGFDTAHPLWEFTLVENLTDRGAAVVMKLHHSLTDGIGGMQLLLVLFDTDSVAPAQGTLPETPVGASSGNGRLVTASIFHGGRTLLDVARNQANAALPRCGGPVGTRCAASEMSSRRCARSDAPSLRSPTRSRRS